jgi:hypothetical protein
MTKRVNSGRIPTVPYETLTLEQLDRLHALLCAWVLKGHSTTALTAQLPGLDEASVLTQQLLDLVEELSTEAPEVHVHRPKGGKPHRYPATPH